MANSGIDAVIVLNSMMARSKREDSRIPAAMPSSIDSGTIMANAIAASIPVWASRSNMMALTGTLKRVE
jgi:hypothetical protein